MLFYHIRLHCYVVVEVKVTEFESSYAGQLGTYVVAVNHQLKTERMSLHWDYLFANQKMI